MPYNEKQDERAILESLRERRAGLEKQRAIKGVDADPSIEMQIKQINQEIAERERSLKDSRGYQLTTLPLLLEKYDSFFKHFAANLPSNENDPIKFRKSLLHSLGNALDVEHILIVQNTGIKWEIIDRYVSGRIAEDFESILDSEIQQLIYRSVRHYEDSKNADLNKYVGITMGRNIGSDRHLIFAPFPDSSPSEVLVLHGIKMETGFDTVIAVILTTLIQTTKNLTTPLSSPLILIDLLNALKRNFFYVSDFMYEQQFTLFKEQLESIVMYYEPIVSLSYYPYICRWEALARDVATEKVPKDLFETCELWGRRFQIQLDIHCLNLAVRSYTSFPKRPKNQDKSQDAKQSGPYKTRVTDILPLSVNVYPETLIRTAYRNAVLDLAKEKLIPLDKLTLELSEKRPLPCPEDSLEGQDNVNWFRDRLIYYTDFGITFAIDDYGVGHASASRLSRLEPAIIKIDRDALLHSRGSHTIQQVLKLQQESMGKMIVVMEGYDDESKLSLTELYKMGIRYVQGHATIGTNTQGRDVKDTKPHGEPVPAEKMYRLDETQENELIKKLP